MTTRLVLFDFDHTLTTNDTFLLIIKYLKGNLNYWVGLFFLSPVLILYKLKLIRNDKAKILVMQYFFKRYPISSFEEKCRDFQQEILPNYIRTIAYATLTKHIQHGDKVVILSASAENWISEWCKNEGVLCIGTKLEVKNEHLTGHIEGKNCYGIEKVNRLKESVDISAYDEIYAYGDSRGDKEMLAIATHPYYRKF